EVAVDVADGDERGRRGGPGGGQPAQRGEGQGDGRRGLGGDRRTRQVIGARARDDGQGADEGEDSTGGEGAWHPRRVTAGPPRRKRDERGRGGGSAAQRRHRPSTPRT